MSQENVKIVRAIHEGWARGDFAVGADLRAPDFEWHQFPQAVEPGTRRGSGVRDAFRTIARCTLFATEQEALEAVGLRE